jgi:predicted deacylase
MAAFLVDGKKFYKILDGYPEKGYTVGKQKGILEMTLLKCYHFTSNKVGKKLLILGAVHGNEHCGTTACLQVIDELNSGKIHLKSGEISFIPVCNPEAAAKNVREIDENLNRIIRPYANPQTYEQHLATELDAYIAQADVIIDLHSTFAKVSRPFVFSDYPDALADKLTAALDIRYILHGWPEVYAQNNAVEDLSTGAVAHQYGKTALTVECGQHEDPSTVATALSVIDRVMQVLGLTEAETYTPCLQENVMMDSLIMKVKAGHFVREFYHLDAVKKGEVLAEYDDGEKLISPQDGYILLPKAYAQVNAEWFYLGHLQKQNHNL